MTGGRFSGLPTPRGKNLAGPRHACGVRRGGHLDFFPGVSVIRRTVRRSRTESITPAGSRPSRSPWIVHGNHSDGSGSVSSDLSHFLPGSKAGTVIVDHGGRLFTPRHPRGFSIEGLEGVRDEPWARKSKSKKSFIRTLLSKPKAAVGVDFQPQKRSGSSVVTRTTWTATVRVRPWQAVTGCHRLSRLSQLSQAVTRCHTISRV